MTLHYTNTLLISINTGNTIKEITVKTRMRIHTEKQECLILHFIVVSTTDPLRCKAPGNGGQHRTAGRLTCSHASMVCCLQIHATQTGATFCAAPFDGYFRS